MMLEIAYLLSRAAELLEESTDHAVNDEVSKARHFESIGAAKWFIRRAVELLRTKEGYLIDE